MLLVLRGGGGGRLDFYYCDPRRKAVDVATSMQTAQINDNGMEGELWRQAQYMGWKKRYYLLEGSNLTRFSDKSDMTSAKMRGGMLLSANVVISEGGEQMVSTGRTKTNIFLIQIKTNGKVRSATPAVSLCIWSLCTLSQIVYTP